MAKKLRTVKVYDWLPFFGLVCLLTLCYIATVHSAEKKIRRINSMHKEVEDIRQEYYTIKQKIMFEGTMYEVAKSVEGLDMTKEVRIPKKIEKIDA